MREILFRGKTYDGEWVYGGYHYEHGFAKVNEKHYITVYETFGAFSYNAFVEVEPETVGQFTGLLDKNGNKIFEGDILKTFYIDELGYVNYNDENTSFEICFKNHSEILGLLNYSYELNIVGNIHDNKEFYNELQNHVK